MQEIVLNEIREPVNDAIFSKSIERLAEKTNRILERLESINITDFAKNLSQSFMSRITRNNERSMKSNLSKSGIDISGQLDAEGLQQLIDVKISENVALIKSIKNDYIEQIGASLRENIMNGQLSTTLITEIKEKGNVSKSRAKFIARDQTAKTNAAITQVRAEALGGKTYRWSGSMDERERHSHRVLEGMLCKFNDHTVYSDDDGKTWKSRQRLGAYIGLVGTDYNCRCVALPIINI